MLSIDFFCPKGSSGNAPQPESLGTKERRGCLLGWEIIDQLRQASKRIKLNIPIAEEVDEIAMYAGRGNAEAHCAGVDNDNFTCAPKNWRCENDARSKKRRD